MQRHSPNRSTRWTLALAAVGLLLGFWGCGNLTMGGVANARIVVSGDAPDGMASLSSGLPPAAPPSAVLPPTGPVRSSHDDGPEGQIELELTLTLVAETGALTRLGDESIEVRLDLRGHEEAETVNELIPVSRYTELRVVFSEIQVQVDDGLIIGGEPVVGEIRIDYDEVNLPVTKEIDLDVVPGAHVELVIDLNAPAWLEAVDPETLTVDPTVFAELMTVVTR